MKEETMDKLNDSFKDIDLYNEKRLSYITKEKFIAFIQELDCSHIKDISLTAITGFKLCKNDRGNKYIETLGIDIRID